MNVLYLTYDGLLDPLGASQILPYVKGIAQSQGRVVVLSFEKAAKAVAGQEQKAKEVEADGIEWKPIRFTTGYGAAGKLWDLLKMYFWAFLLAKKYSVQIIHARGHTAAQVGLFLKKFSGTKLIFDFRGLWVDERVDKGGWNLSHLLHRLQYRHFKKTERKLLQGADQIVVLTHAVVNEVVRIGAISPSMVTVIPCCADFDHFTLSTAKSRADARMDLHIPDDALVLGYLGSVGRMYMLDRYFRFFEIAASQHKNVHALLITQDIDILIRLITDCLPAALHSRVHIISSSRQDLPKIIPAMDVLVSFILPSYARMAASPTKLAECFATGIPAVCNAGVGDVAETIVQLGAGVIVDPASDADLCMTADRLIEISAMGGSRLRDKARVLLGLELASERYLSVYSKIESGM
jgi:glycosyltransferase involved in cell wall biosynthesis